MKKFFLILLGMMLAVGTSSMVFAAEHGGQEHGGETHANEHGGQEQGDAANAEAVQSPSNDDIRNTMSAYVTAQSLESGTFDIEDAETSETLHLSLELVHDRVGKTGDYYYSCADFKDVNTGEMYDLDIDVADNDGVLSVADVRIHKVGGIARYTYDDNDNRISLNTMEESTQEHGGNEHAGE